MASTLELAIHPIHGQDRRVIVGFNAFGHDIGSMVQQAPEHSDAFRRQVQAQRLLQKKRLSLQALKRNKPLSKLLVLAKRAKIKQAFQQAQARLAQEIPPHLPTTVQRLMDQFGTKTLDECWPNSPVDVQVYLHHQVQEGKYKVVNECLEDVNSRDLLSPLATIELVESPEQ